MHCPEAGEIVWLTFDPQAGREQAGRCPALVLSPKRHNQVARLCILCPITNTVRGWPLETSLKDSGASTTGVVLCDQVKSLSWFDRDCSLIEECPPAVVRDVKAKIKALLAI